MDNTAEIADILLKAAEDVQAGLWCTGSWFKDPKDEDTAYADTDMVITGNLDYSNTFHTESVGILFPVEKISRMQRCAEGSIMLSAIIAGPVEGVYDLYEEAKAEVVRQLNGAKPGTDDLYTTKRSRELATERYHCGPDPGTHSLNHHNDMCVREYVLEQLNLDEKTVPPPLSTNPKYLDHGILTEEGRRMFLDDNRDWNHNQVKALTSDEGRFIAGQELARLFRDTAEALTS